MTNVVVVKGALSRPPEERILPSGTAVVGFEVSVRTGGEGRAETVPVAWTDAPASALSLGTGDEVVVLGRVRRRFFRAAGGTQSRTEVVAEAVVPARQAKKVAALVDRAIDTLGAP